MSSQTIEVIDTSNMEILAEFPAAGFVNENTDRFRIGIVGTDVIITERNLRGDWSGGMLFERSNLAAFAQLLNEVLKGKLRKEDRDEAYFEAGKDKVGFGVQALPDKITVSFFNNRRAKIDGYEAPYWDMYVAPDTALKMSVELDRIIADGTA